MSRDRRSAPQQSPNFVWEALDSQTGDPGAASGRDDALVVAMADGEGEDAARDGRHEPGARRASGRASGRALIAAAVLVPLAGGSYAVLSYTARHDDTAVIAAQASQAPGLDTSANSVVGNGPTAGTTPGGGMSPNASPSSKTSLSPSPSRSGAPAALGSTKVPGLLVTTVAVTPGQTTGGSGGSSGAVGSGGAATATATHAAAPPAGPPTGTIVGYEGLCLDDRGATVVNYNPIQVHTCNGTDAEQWTLESNYTVQVFGMCLDVYAAGTTGGTRVDLYQCNGTKAQTWVAQSDGALVNPESGMCLDDTEFGGTGTQVEIWTCNGGSDQVWKLP